MLDKSLAFLMPVHVWWRLESQNLHRHQKNQTNQTTRCTKPAQASKKPKKTKLWASTQGWGSIDHKSFVFFCFFLMPVQVLWRSCFGFFGFFECLVKVRVTKPAQASKKQKKQTTRCTKPAQASKKTKKNKTLSIYSGLGVYRSQKFCLFCFFGCLCRFCEDHALFFLFFLMPVHVWWRLESQNLHRHQQKQKKNKPLDAQNLHRHQKKQKKQNSEHLLRVGGL